MPAVVPTVVDDPGKNSIADLEFGSTSLQVVHADNNDLYSLKGLKNNASLHTLTYSYNHINGIDLSGCSSLPAPNVEDPNHYNCSHNVRGLIPGELAVWQTTENGVTTRHELYYFQLDPQAQDGVNGASTFLGYKSGQDSLMNEQDPGYGRTLETDGFNPDKVLEFTVNSSGPIQGTRGSTAAGAPRRDNVETVPPGTSINPALFYGKIAIIQCYDNTRNYIEYLYDDGRPSATRNGGGGSGFGIAWRPPGDTPTGIDETMTDGLGEVTVVSERYYDTAGHEHSQPINGVNIIVRQMSDGTTQTTKLMKY
jgi:hypothetical protein